MTSFSEALRAELQRHVCNRDGSLSGPVTTEFHDVAQRWNSRVKQSPAIVNVSVEQVVRDALAAVEANRAIVIPGALMKIAMAIVRLIPMPILRRGLRLFSSNGDR